MSNKKINKILISILLISTIIIGLSITEDQNLSENSEINNHLSNFESTKIYGKGNNPTIFQEETVEIINLNNTYQDLSRALHDYNTVTSELHDIANNYSNIATIHDLGQSVQGRSIWGLRITDNPTIEENEAEVRICGAHHGDELMSVEMPMLLAWHLVENYSIDPTISDLIDNREIWIIPLVNPDGRMNTPSPKRRNANNVDLNRDYGYIWEGEGGSSGPFSQPETQVMRMDALDNFYSLSLSFHCSGDYVNYIWNHKGQPVRDHDVVVYLSNIYGSYNGYTVIEGYDWYRTTGDTNDFSYGCCGDIDWTIEVDDTYQSPISDVWDLNRDGMMDIIEYSNMGLTGIVTDNSSGLPVRATVWVEEAYWPCYTDPKVGDYHKPLMPGNYNVHFRANGYEEAVYNVDVTDPIQPTYLNVSLNKNNELYAYMVTWYYCYDPYSSNNYQNNPTEGISALGPPDNISASIGVDGEIVLDMSPETIISNNPGDDFIVFEGDDINDGYNVEVSENWNGPWISLGSGMGTSSFDLDYGSVNSARFIKIQDDGDGSPYDLNPGFDLDAIQVINNETIKFNITSIKNKWNFISVPFNYSTDITDVFVNYNGFDYTWAEATNPINGPIIDPNVYGWDRNLDLYTPTTSFDPGYGYWIYSYFDCELFIENISLIPDNYITNLKASWNSIGIPDNQSMDLTDLIINYNGMDYTWTEAIDPVNGPIIDPNVYGWNRDQDMYVQVSNYLETGYAYWLYVYYGCILKQ